MARIESLSARPSQDAVEYGQEFTITCIVSETDEKVRTEAHEGHGRNKENRGSKKGKREGRSQMREPIEVSPHSWGVGGRGEAKKAPFPSAGISNGADFLWVFALVFISDGIPYFFPSFT